MSDQSPSVSVVIPTWNRCDLATACLESVARQTYVPHEVLVVDDGSTDDTAVEIGRRFPSVKVLRLERNQGFAVAVNHGIRAATGDFIFLLNNDMTLDPECIERLVATVSRTCAAMIAPLVLWRDRPEHIYSAGDRILTNGRPESIGFRALRSGFAPPSFIFGVSAGAGMFSRSLFARVGLLDESFTAYFEDADLCFRARLAGFTAALCPEAIAYHIGSASLTGRTWWRARQCFRNHALLVIKNMPGPVLLRFLPRILRERLHQARRCFSASRAAFGALRALMVLIGASISLWAALPKAVRARYGIQRVRVLSSREVTQLLRRDST